MADVVDQATRSRMMASIKGANTTPEIALRKAMHALGLRFRLHAKKMPGRPDIVLPRWKAVVFVHGCFWHRHEGCPNATHTATRPDFWKAKFKANVERDHRNIKELQDKGWYVLVIWECSIKSRGAAKVAEEVQQSLAARARLKEGAPPSIVKAQT